MILLQGLEMQVWLGTIKVDVPSSNIRQGVARILKDYGYIKTFRVAQDGKQGLMRVYLNYDSKGTVCH